MTTIITSTRLDFMLLRAKAYSEAYSEERPSDIKFMAKYADTETERRRAWEKLNKASNCYKYRR